jgi:hypothetical protein
MKTRLTDAEWNALVGAAVLQQAEWEQDGDEMGHVPTQRLAALDRALTKVGRELRPRRRASTEGPEQ